MKRIFGIVLAALLCVLHVAAQKESRERIEWQPDYKTAQALARETGKPLLLDFTAVWCAPCRAMEKDFWTLPDVIEAMKAFVAVKINYDEERSLAGRFIVRGLPYIAFVDPIGNLITHRKGFSADQASELNDVFKEMPRDFSPLKNAYDRIEANPNAGLALLKIADFYRDAGMPLLSNVYYERANRSYEVNKTAENRERIQAFVGQNFYAAGDYPKAIDAWEKYLKFFPNGKYEETVVAELAAGYAKTNRLVEAVRILETLKAKFPDSKKLAATAKIVREANGKNGK